MKKIMLFSISTFLSISAFAQYTLEHTYNNTGYFKSEPGAGGSANNGLQLFYLIHLEIDGDKYVQIDKMSQTMIFYNLDHSLWKSINYSTVSTNIGPDASYDKSGCSILYISQSLFNTDTKVEFMYTYNWYVNATTSLAITQIVNEDGTILFTDAAAPQVQPTYHNQFYPIYNTTNGTKMILSNVNGTAEVFSLTGTFTSGIATNNILGNAEMSLFPNPSTGSNMITINYALPSETHTANLLVFDTQGRQVKSYKIGNNMNSILVNPTELSRGTYFYSILTEDGRTIASRKAILVQ